MSRPPHLDPRLAARMSVKKAGGIGLAGMAGWGENANSGIMATTGLKKALALAAGKFGCVKMVIEGEQLVGSMVRTNPGQTWGEKLDMLQQFVEGNNPVYFALFRGEKQCLVVTYIPDMAKPAQKMWYASTKNAVKDAILDSDDGCQLEEFNVSAVEEMTYKEYSKRETIEKPYTEAELMRQEHDTAETAGGYGVLARLMQAEQKKMKSYDAAGEADAKPFALPGLSGPGGAAGILALKNKLKKRQPSEEGVVTPKPVEEEIIKPKPVPVPVDAPPSPVEVEEEEKAEEEEKEVDDFLNGGKVDAKEDEDAASEKDNEEEQANEEEQPRVVNQTDSAAYSEADLIDVLGKKADEEENDKEEDDEQEEELEEVKPQKKEPEEDADEDEVSVKEEEEKVYTPQINNDDEEEDEGDAALPTPPPKNSVMAPRLEESTKSLAQQMVEAEQGTVPIQRGASFKAAQGLKNIVKKFADTTETYLRKLSKGSPNTISEEVLNDLDNTDGVLTMDQILDMQRTKGYGGYDKGKLESYLSEQEFARVFNMTRETFNKQSKWKKEKLKKKYGLF